MEYEYSGKKFLERLQSLTGNKSQAALAAELGITQGTVSKWKNIPPSGRDLIKIVETYHCSIDYLLGIEKPKEPAAVPSYPDLLRCIDALVSRGLAEIVDYKDTETETMQLANCEWWESHDTRKALVFNTNSITQTLNEYLQIRKTIKAADSKQFAEMLKKLWLEKEMKKDCPLTKDGMQRLSALRDFADTIPE